MKGANGEQVDSVRGLGVLCWEVSRKEEGLQLLLIRRDEFRFIVAM